MDGMVCVDWVCLLPNTGFFLLFRNAGRLRDCQKLSSSGRNMLSRPQGVEHRNFNILRLAAFSRD
jgi:hypothetical protein